MSIIQRVIPDLDNNPPSDLTGPAVRSIGFIDIQGEYETGKPSRKFVERLIEHYKKPFFPYTPWMQGFESCLECKEIPKSKWGKKLVVGPFCVVGELIVPTNRYVYVAPFMIAHYVADHFYQPPQGFIDAIENSRSPDSDEFSKKFEHLINSNAVSMEKA